MRIAIIEASHWHVPLYLDALERDSASRVTAVSDETGTRGPVLADRFAAVHYDDWRQLVANEEIDFAFVFGRHDEMFDIAADLIERGVPFAIEKPAGLSSSDVATLHAMATSRNHFVSVPLILGFSDLIRELHTASEPVNWRHMSFRFIAGPISRYIDAHCEWMLEERKAGGGCTRNLAVHCIDVFRRLTGSTVQSVSARMLRDSSVAEVELYSVMTLKTDTGQVCTVETGYTYPGETREQREFTFSLASSQSYVHSTDAGLRTTFGDGKAAKDLVLDLNTDPCYAEFVRRSLQDYREQREPAAGLGNLLAIMNVVDAAYASDRHGGGPVEVSD